MADSQALQVAPTTEPRNFIESRAPTFHEAFGVEASFNAALRQYKPTEVSDLEETLKRLQTNTSLQDEFQYDLLSATWDDVLRELARAQVAASDSEAHGRTFMGKLWRKMGNNGAESTETLLSSFPKELSILHGGLVVMFSLARQRSQSRRKILSAFEDIPSVLMMAYGKVESIPCDLERSQQLHRSVADLQSTMLRVLPELIERLNPNTFVQKMASPFKGYDVDNLLSMIRVSGERVRVVAEAIMDTIAVGTNQTVNKSYEAMKTIHNKQEQAEADVGDLRGMIAEMQRQQKDFLQVLDSVHVKNYMMSFLNEYLKPGQMDSPPLRKSPDPSLPEYEPATPVTPRQIFRLMSVRYLASLDAEKHIIRRGHTLDTDAVAQAAAMFNTPQLHDLLHLPKSGVVLVNACGNITQHGKISPISHVCASLTQTLRRPQPGSIVVAFFCGQHRTVGDDLVGPQGLMRSLVAFLALGLVEHKYIDDDEAIWFPNVQGDLEELSFGDLCQVFYRLVKHVPKGGVVHCIIDSISYYEREEWYEEYDAMMQCFSRLILDESLGAVFKLLLTSPTVSRRLKLDEHQMVSLRNARRDERSLRSLAS